MAVIDIKHREVGQQGRYWATIDGAEGEAELTYTRRGEKLIDAHHTYAPPSMRGTGAALALVERLIADARAGGFKIVPTCSYIAVQSKRHPQWADVIAQ